MRTLKITLLASAAAMGFAGAAVAADPIVMIDDPVIDNFSPFPWDGVYAGVFGTAQVAVAPAAPAVYGLGVNLGVNVLVDPLLIGVEGDIAWLWNGGANSWQGQVHGRLGALVTDEVLIYGLAGLGANSVTSTYVPVGAGIEVALTDNLSVKAQYEYHWDLDNQAVDSAHVGKIGFNFHF